MPEHKFTREESAIVESLMALSAEKQVRARAIRDAAEVQARTLETEGSAALNGGLSEILSWHGVEMPPRAEIFPANQRRPQGLRWSDAKTGSAEDVVAAARPNGQAPQIKR